MFAYSLSPLLLPPHSPSLWQRRFVQPITAQFRQGITPDQIALTLAVAAACGLFPLLGFTTVLCGMVAVWNKLNQPLIQFLCLCMYPAHLATLLPFYRAGEMLFAQPTLPLSIPFIIKAFFANGLQFLRDYGMTGVRGVIVWALIAPGLGGAVYFLTRPWLRRWAQRSVL